MTLIDSCMFFFEEKVAPPDGLYRHVLSSLFLVKTDRDLILSEFRLQAEIDKKAQRKKLRVF